MPTGKLISSDPTLCAAAISPSTSSSACSSNAYSEVVTLAMPTLVPMSVDNAEKEIKNRLRL
jgi:hypothetical protein